jgi:acyl-coenzyme A synthetase/AMP-(fatty) acid ligase
LQDVADCASVAISSTGGEMVERFASFVVAAPGSELSTGRILHHLNSALGATKCPDLVLFRESIPRTATGKVRLQELQEAAKGNL